MKNIFIALLTWCSIQAAWCQRNVQLTLEDAINLAQSESPDVKVAESQLTNSKWRNIAFDAGFKPQLRLDATLPSLNRQIDAINLPDGSVQFINRSFMNNNIGVSLFQQIRQTGGNFSVGTSLNRLDLFETESQNYSRSYLSTPISVSFNQPLFQFNRFDWDKKQNDLTFETQKKRYTENKELVAFNTMNNFFQLYVTNIQLENARKNLVYLDSLNTIAEGRFSVGRIAETEMLQVKLSAKNAKANVSALELNVQTQTEELRDFLGIKEEVTFDLTAPSNPPMYLVDKDIALQQALQNKSRTLEFRQRLLQAEREVAEAKQLSAPEITLQGTVGLTQTSNSLGDSYRNLLDQERVSLRLSVPIADWGLSKAQKEIAKSNLELEQLQVARDQTSFERDIAINVNQLELRRKQLTLQKEALDVAELRMDIAKKRYQIGKTDVLDLNVAIQEHRTSIGQYYNALWEVWRAHYQIRNLTLYDFVEQRGIVYEVDAD